MKKQMRSFFLIAIITLTICELISRFFVSRVFHCPYWQSSAAIHAFYPELLSLPARLEKDKINILILGGSAITDTLCHTSKNVAKGLMEKGIAANVYNLAQFAHNTQDARVKFRHCKDLGFDYVFVYNAINDTRTNNCPDNIFRRDYSHILFYSQVNILERHPEMGYVTLPFVLDYCWNELAIKAHIKQVIPKEYFVINPKLMGINSKEQIDSGAENIKAINKFFASNQDKIVGTDLVQVDSLWWSEGSKIKSANSFRANIENIYSSKPKSTTLILTDYAWYQCADYSLHKFLYDTLDYAEQRWPTEIYGRPDNVVKGIKTHNRIIDSLVNKYQDILYFNFNDSIPHNKNYFNDICHLADSGQILVSNILVNKISVHIKSGNRRARENKK